MALAGTLTHSSTTAGFLSTRDVMPEVQVTGIISTSGSALSPTCAHQLGDPLEGFPMVRLINTLWPPNPCQLSTYEK